MHKLSITQSENSFKIMTPHGEFEFPINNTSTDIFQLLLPLYQSENSQMEEMTSQILPQYFYSIQTIDLFDKWQRNETFGKRKEFDEMQHYLIQWNFFLQDMMKFFEIEIPDGMYDIHN